MPVCERPNSHCQLLPPLGIWVAGKKARLSLIQAPPCWTEAQHPDLDGGGLLSPPLQVMGVYSVPAFGSPFPGEQVSLLSWGEGQLNEGLLSMFMDWTMVSLCPGESSP